MRLLCQEFQINVSMDDLPVVRAKFILPISPMKIDEIADALRLVTRYMGKEIDLVQAGAPGTIRCFYCGQLTVKDTVSLECRKCGGSLYD